MKTYTVSVYGAQSIDRFDVEWDGVSEPVDTRVTRATRSDYINNVELFELRPHGGSDWDVVSCGQLVSRGSRCG